MNDKPEENYLAIATFNFASMANTYKLVGCARCGGAVVDDDLFRKQHDTWHAVIEELIK